MARRSGPLRQILLLVAAPVLMSAQTTYNVASAFEGGFTAHTNPNGVWSYGYSSSFTGPVTLFDTTTQPGINGPNAQYWMAASIGYPAPAAEYNDGTAYDDGNVNFLAHEFLLVAGIDITTQNYADLVFTAPTTTNYTVNSSFRGSQYGIGVVVGVIVKGKVIFSSTVTSEGQIVPFRKTIKLNAGQRIVFSVGPGSGAQNTGLAVTIKQQ